MNYGGRVRYDGSFVLLAHTSGALHSIEVVHKQPGELPDVDLAGLSPRDTLRVIPNQIFGRRTGCSRSAQIGHSETVELI
jgi:hypothetical protein